MTTLTETRLPEALQGLIDARLDTIDRMLLGRLPRGERTAIVAQVEEQLQEMLAEHTGDDWTREDVLDVLARLDPPEAYLPEAGEPGTAPTARPTVRPIPSRKPTAAARARLGGVLGIISLVLSLLGPVVIVGVSMLLQSELPLFGGGPLVILAVLAMGTTGIVLSVRDWNAGGWAWAGLVLNVASMVVLFLTCILAIMFL